MTRRGTRGAKPRGPGYDFPHRARRDLAKLPGSMSAAHAAGDEAALAYLERRYYRARRYVAWLDRRAGGETGTPVPTAD